MDLGTLWDQKGRFGNARRRHCERFFLRNDQTYDICRYPIPPTRIHRDSYHDRESYDDNSVSCFCLSHSSVSSSSKYQSACKEGRRAKHDIGFPEEMVLNPESYHDDSISCVLKAIFSCDYKSKFRLLQIVEEGEECDQQVPRARILPLLNLSMSIIFFQHCTISSSP